MGQGTYKASQETPWEIGTQSINRLKTHARGPNWAKPRLSATKRTRIASSKRSPTPQRYKKQRLTSLSSPSSSSDESHHSSDTASATSSSATSNSTSNRSRHYSSSSRDERQSSKPSKRRSARTSHVEKGRQNFGTPNMAAITKNGKDTTDPANYHGPRHHPVLALRTTPLSARAHVMPMVGYQPHTHYPPSLKTAEANPPW